ncbi:L-rhamnose mutarotase [Rufibacter glacialis]|uniref:L-rhamnose mutarotase n=1 Tax=Rufibacter glacialis TaxID=1259555 RepID=A0A5M8QKJ1_9BACT|nr:L-rhamnose mutarotase [Rufibacter glacialis]KAA6434802.1 L-rhamnose mutarotase [Rufibacter glacialis]GGK72567.1 L-fucose mutarotase [Rufibacter glacialis]
MPRYCLTLDLKNDPALISEYEQYHQAVWPEIIQSLLAAGIEHLEIYRWQNRLCMLLEVNEAFSFERKNQLDAANPKVQEWEKLMWTYQQALPGTKEGEKWQLMNPICAL